MSITRLIIVLFAPIYILLCSGSAGIQKQTPPITLKDEKLNFTPHEFYIADVADERANRNLVVSLIDGKDAAHTPININLKDGAAVSIKNFLYRNLHRDTSLRPVMLTIKKFKITEDALPGGRIEGHLEVAFSFALQLSYNTVHLVDYSAGLRYNRPGNQPADVESFLREGIVDGVSYFNTWINSHADNRAALAKKVKVSFTDFTENPEGDTIYYSVSRPLTWADFSERPHTSGYDAEVFTSIGYNEHREVKNGVINLNLVIKVDLPKSDCWVKGGRGDSYMLNHEQRHFDIEKVVGEHFKKKILAMELPVDNFDGPINVEYLETLREATAMQKQYDAETHHGENRQAQEQWNEKIDQELRTLGVKK
jgi:hypothetical protein